MRPRIRCGAKAHAPECAARTAARRVGAEPGAAGPWWPWWPWWPRSPRRRAFTLLELIVVIAIIALLSTITAVATGWILPDSRRKVAVAGMREILAAAEIHSTRYGSHPESIRDLLDARDEMGRPSPLLTGDPRDPWGHEFVYEVVDESPRVTCLGRDGQPGGAGEDADIVIPAPRAE